MQRSRGGSHVIASSLFLVICCLQIAPSLQDCQGGCEQRWDPVCGSDGKTHANKCIAKCAGAAVNHAGRCKTFTSNFAAHQESFACTDNCEQKWDPVCGSDGRTHANKCIAKCAGATVKHTGRCKTFTSNFAAHQESFACTDNCEQKWDPVCGSDGKTYANKCIAKCAGATVKHTGRCTTFTSNFAARKIASNLDAVSTNGRRVCSGVYDPVCGEDNRTYSNECLALRANVGIKHAGPCMR